MKRIARQGFEVALPSPFSTEIEGEKLADETSLAMSSPAMMSSPAKAPEQDRGHCEPGHAEEQQGYEPRCAGDAER